jgi:hypothetical protein
MKSAWEEDDAYRYERHTYTRNKHIPAGELVNKLYKLDMLSFNHLHHLPPPSAYEGRYQSPC